MLGAVFFFALAASQAWGEWRQFVPTPVTNDAFIESYTSYERESGGSSADTRWTDLFFRQRFTLESTGYSYHPRFLQYHLALSGLATQEEFDSSFSNGDGGWSTGGGFEYDTTLSFLPEHPYNLVLFASRYEPAYKEQAGSSHDTVADTYGAAVRYRQKPYFFNANYVDQSIDSDVSWSRTQRLAVNTAYIKTFASGDQFALQAAANPSWSSASGDLSGETQEYAVDNFIRYRRASLSSAVTQSIFNQDTNAKQKYDTNQKNWYERLSVAWPWSFRSDLSYHRYDDRTDVKYTDETSDRSYDQDGDRVELNLAHKLYRSLDSSYAFMWEHSDSSGGSVEVVSNIVNVNYVKTIPYGSFVSGVMFGRMETDNQGFADIVAEPYSNIYVPGTFTLRQDNVDPKTILVFLRSPLPPFDAIQLIENVNYKVVPLGNTFQIQVFSLPAEFVVPGTYGFALNYSLVTGDYTLQTDTLGTNFGLHLFGDLLAPYFSYRRTRTDTVSGDFDGTPADSDVYITGLQVRYGSWRARGEYQDVQWQVNPYWTWLTEIQYSQRITPTVNVYSALTYRKRSYTGGNDEFGSTEHDEDALTGSGSIQKQVFLRNLYLSAGASYTNVWGPVDTQAWSMDSSLIWKIGKLEIKLGVSAYGADSSGSDIYATSHDHELVYLNLKRGLL